MFIYIQKTTTDLLDLGYDVHVVADAVSSRSQVNYHVALYKIPQYPMQIYNNTVAELALKIS